MENEVDLAIVLQAMREQIGAMAQENAILAARLKKIEQNASVRDCGCSQND